MNAADTLAALTLQEFAPEDFDTAAAWARRLGYNDSTAYATSSGLPGLYCLPYSGTRGPQRQTVICKSAQFGLIAVQTLED